MAEIDSNKVPKFLKRLFRETSDPENKQICWSNDGKRIVIVDKDKFIKTTLKKLSRTKDYSGFVRQLNMYSFVKIKTDRNTSTEEYCNSFFRKDEPEQLEQIVRIKKHEVDEMRLNQSVVENNLTYLTASNFRLSNEIAELRERVERQECTINGLLEILGKVFRTGAQSVNYENKIMNMSKDFTSKLIANKMKDDEQNINYGNQILNTSKNFTPNLLGNMIKDDSEDGKTIEEKSTTNTNHIIKDMDDIFF